MYLDCVDLDTKVSGTYDKGAFGILIKFTVRQSMYLHYILPVFTVYTNS